MKCKIHSNEDAIGMCIKCGYAFCSNCLDTTLDPLICISCKYKKLILWAEDEAQNYFRTSSKQLTAAVISFPAGLILITLMISWFIKETQSNLETPIVYITIVIGMFFVIIGVNLFNKSRSYKITAINISSALTVNDGEQSLSNKFSALENTIKEAVGESNLLLLYKGMAGDMNQKSIIVNPGKSVFASLILTFFFGPLGMFYSTIPGALIMLIFYILVGIVTLGLGLVILHPITMIWGAMAVSSYNRRIMKNI